MTHSGGSEPVGDPGGDPGGDPHRPKAAQIAYSVWIAPGFARGEPPSAHLVATYRCDACGVVLGPTPGQASCHSCNDRDLLISGEWLYLTALALYNGKRMAQTEAEQQQRKQQGRIEPYGGDQLA